jgi:hypothetical protein
MSFLENLQSLVKFDFDLSKLKNLTVKLINNNTIKDFIHVENKIVIINVQAVPPDKSREVKELIKKSVTEEGQILLQDKSKKLVDEITVFESSGHTLDLVEFFRGKVSASDLEILRASLFVKDVYDRGGQVGDLKRSIIMRHGDRGRNIVNLCTAGYFSSIIKPLYLEMQSQSDFTIEKFLSTYNTIIMNYPFAIFVSNTTTLAELESEVEKKMAINKQYGINNLNLHGIGEDNIDKITAILEKFKEKFTHRPTFDSERRYIMVTIWF